VVIPADINVRAAYPIAVTRRAADSELARAFVDFVLSPAGQAILQKYGFGAP
jgi:molybdate transport system substrate-binding protein